MRKIKVYFRRGLYSLLKKFGRMIYTDNDVEIFTNILKRNVFDRGYLNLRSVIKDNDDKDTIFYTVIYDDGSVDGIKFRLSLGVNQSGFDMWFLGTEIVNTTLLKEIFDKIEYYKPSFSMFFLNLQKSKGLR